MAKQANTSIDVLEISTNQVNFCVLGRTPIILNRMSEKAKYELLFPKGRKTAAQRASSLKHEPLKEFRQAPYLLPDDAEPTLLAHLSTAFKNAIRGAGVDVPGATKAQLGRLLWVEGEKVGIFGMPKLFMSVTRSADMNRTPDVRTRVIVPEWACRLTVSFVSPQLTTKTVGNLLAAGGLIQGVGDWRPEKGSGSYGQFELVDEKNADFRRIMKIGRAEQQRGMDHPEAYDQETEDLLAWFYDEAGRRGIEVAK